MTEIGRTCACLHTRMAAREITRFYAAAIRPAGLEATRFSLLGALAVGGAPSVARLAERLAIERTALLRNLKLLVRDGLIAPDEASGKGVAYRLTASGEAALRRAIPLWREAQGRVEAALGAKGLSAYRGSLRDLRHALRAPTGAAAP